MTDLANSPVSKLFFAGREWLVKRDDLISEKIGGNKARKLYGFATRGFGATKVISYGGAQSNAMYSISELCKEQNIEFEYYAKTLPKTLREAPQGNLKAALENGMRLIELNYAEYNDTVTALLCSSSSNTLVIRQGGADYYAKEGLEILARELEEYADANRLQNPIALLSSGTGTSAAYLANALPFECATTPCVSDGEFLKREFERFGVGKTPTIFSTKEKIAFASPHPKLLGVYKELLAAGVEFDLLYDAKCWLAISENLGYFEGRDAIFVHSGGTLGNKTQLARYAHKGLF